MKKKVKKSNRGRPKGSKNKVVEPVKKTYVSYKSIELPEDYKAPAAEKFLGYCKCNFAICSSDLTSVRIYFCPCCNKKMGIGKLKKTIIRLDVPTSKKEYLDQTINAKYNDMPGTVDSEETVVKGPVEANEEAPEAPDEIIDGEEEEDVKDSKKEKKGEDE